MSRTNFSGRSRVSSTEQNLSLPTISPDGDYGFIQIPNPQRGKMNVPVLVHGVEDFLSRYTTNGKPDVTDSLAYFHALLFLSQSNKLWVQGVRDNTTARKASITLTSDATTPTVVSGGLEIDPADSYTMLSTDIVTIYAKDEGLWGNGLGVRTRHDTDTTDVYFIDVYLNNVQVESFRVCNVAKLDTAGQTLLLSDVIKGSQYVDAMVNPVVGNTRPPVSVVTPLNPPNTYGGATNKYLASGIPTLTKTGANFFITLFDSTPSGQVLATNTVQQVVAGDAVIDSSYEPKRVYEVVASGTNLVLRPYLGLHSMTGGNNGATVTEGMMVSATHKASNSKQFPISIVMDGGWATPLHTTALDNLAKSRTDCVICASIPAQHYKNSDAMRAVVDYSNIDLNLNTSYTTLVAGMREVYDIYNDRVILIHGSAFQAGIIARNGAEREFWYPPAGWTYGLLWEGGDVVNHWLDGELDYLYDNNLNPLVSEEGKGVSIQGNKTLHRSKDELHWLSTRLMLVKVRPTIKRALDDFRFKLNTVEQRDLATRIVTLFMSTVKGGNGVYDFKVVCNDTNNNSKTLQARLMYLTVYVKPMPDIEWIPFNTVITPTTVSFNDAIQLSQGV